MAVCEAGEAMQSECRSAMIERVIRSGGLCESPLYCAVWNDALGDLRSDGRPPSSPIDVLREAIPAVAQGGVVVAPTTSSRWSSHGGSDERGRGEDDKSLDGVLPGDLPLGRWEVSAPSIMSVWNITRADAQEAIRIPRVLAPGRTWHDKATGRVPPIGQRGNGKSTPASTARLHRGRGRFWQWMYPGSGVLSAKDDEEDEDEDEDHGKAVRHSRMQPHVIQAAHLPILSLPWSLPASGSGLRSPRRTSRPGHWRALHFTSSQYDWTPHRHLDAEDPVTSLDNHMHRAASTVLRVPASPGNMSGKQ